MASKSIRNNSVLRVVEYRVSEIDEHGDAIDVNGFETRREANGWAKRLMESGSVAIVIERHTRYYPAHLVDEPDRYVTLAIIGDEDALAAGDWDKD